jgi:hypothetical protein
VVVSHNTYLYTIYNPTWSHRFSEQKKLALERNIDFSHTLGS